MKHGRWEPSDEKWSHHADEAGRDHWRRWPVSAIRLEIVHETVGIAGHYWGAWLGSLDLRVGMAPTHEEAMRRVDAWWESERDRVTKLVSGVDQHFGSGQEHSRRRRVGEWVLTDPTETRVRVHGTDGPRMARALRMSSEAAEGALYDELWADAVQWLDRLASDIERWRGLCRAFADGARNSQEAAQIARRDAPTPAVTSKGKVAGVHRRGTGRG